VILLSCSGGDVPLVGNDGDNENVSGDSNCDSQ
jgi:hypothetical protein